MNEKLAMLDEDALRGLAEFGDQYIQILWWSHVLIPGFIILFVLGLIALFLYKV